MGYPIRKLEVDVLEDADDNIECILVPVAVGLIPFFRIFFDEMKGEGAWLPDSYERARRYFGWQEAQMLCKLGQQLEQQNNETNNWLLTVISVLLMSLSDGLISPAISIPAMQLLQEVLSSGASSGPDWDTSMQWLSNLTDNTLGKDSNQVEPYLLKVAELLGGPGVLPAVD